MPKIQGPFFFPEGLTVKEFKAIVAAWPETDGHGEDAEVWIETGKGLSNQVISIVWLNQGDMILEPSDTVWD